MKDGKKLIVIADDEREIRDIVSLLLTDEDYTAAKQETQIQKCSLFAA